jgi:hypothetical protein
LYDGLLVVCDSSTFGDDLVDFGRRQHAGRASTGPAIRALLEFAAGPHASGVLHRETAAVEAQAERNALRIDVVAPQELESQLDLGHVGVCLGDRAKAVDRGVPDAVDIIGHHVKPVEIGLHLLEIEAAEVPVRGGLSKLVTDDVEVEAERGDATYESQTDAIFPTRGVQALPQTSQKINVIVEVGGNAASVLCHGAGSRVSLHTRLDMC